MVKSLPVMREIQVRSLGQEDPLEKEMTTHSSILAWKIPWTEESGSLQSMESQESDTTEQRILSLFWALEEILTPGQDRNRRNQLKKKKKSLFSLGGRKPPEPTTLTLSKNKGSA